MTGRATVVSDKQMESLVKAFHENYEGLWSNDVLTRGIYATDASHYQQIPVVVTWPRDENEVLSIIRIARENSVPLLGRGAGTSLAGQTVTTGIVLDFSRYMDKVLEWNYAEQWVRVQPGVVRDVLNKEAAKHGLQFAPDPATSNRATIGGMIANNSSGTRSVKYGKTIDHLMELRVALSTGEIIDFKAGSDDTIPQIQELSSLVSSNADIIAERFPTVMRRVGGYPLDYLTPDREFNPAMVFCGSEGTLGIILEAKIRLVSLPASQSVAILHFEDTRQALRQVEGILTFAPSAVELLDKPVLELGRKNNETSKLMKGIDPNAGALLLVEFSGDRDDEVKQQADHLVNNMTSSTFKNPVRVAGIDPDYHFPWELRKKGLGILMGDPSDKKPLAFVEDSCVPVASLPEYIDDVLEICKSEGTDAIVYAHASVGVIHVRPLLDLSNIADIQAMKRISEQVFDRVCHYKGAWSGEHGDGLVRSYKNREFFGDEIYELFQRVKRIFDPVGIMNPGKVVDGPSILDDLRMGADYKLTDLPEEEFLFSDTNGFSSTVHLCSGVGECLKKDKGVMCPSYRATEDEEHSTRGRANALRLAISGQLEDGINNARLKDALSLCLSCKACKTECPSNVDMARLKSQVYSWNYRKNGVDLRTRIFSNAPLLARKLSGGSAKWVNKLINSPISKIFADRFLGIARERELPPFSSSPLVEYTSSKNEIAGQSKVVLFADTYTSFHEDQIGRKAIRLLEHLGFEISLFAKGCCQRPALSLGLLEKAKVNGQKTLLDLLEFAGDAPVIVLEPGCASALIDDLPDLFNDRELSEVVKSKVYLLEEFLYDHDENSEPGDVRLKLKNGSYAVHGHCHHKALWGMEHMKSWFAKNVEGDILWMDSGCCGMAGAFGYEKENQVISGKIAEQSVFSKIRAFPSRKILATGFSCRHQINDLGDNEVMHWLEALDLS